MAHRRVVGRRAAGPESAEEQHRRGTIPKTSAFAQVFRSAAMRNLRRVTQSEERAARNEISFREANEKLGEKRLELKADGFTPFLCECSAPRCTQLIRLTLGDYERVRSNPTRFLVAAGHDAGEATTVEEHDEYAVVEKTGVAGELAEDEDPRDD